VSWFSYSTTAESLRLRQDESESRIKARCEQSCEALHADLDRRLLRQAQLLVGVSQSAYVHAEGQSFLFNLLAAQAPGNANYLNPALLCYQGTNDRAAQEIYRWQPLSTFVENADKLIAEPDGTHAQDYFQIYRSNGFPLQRSESLGEEWFT